MKGQDFGKYRGTKMCVVSNIGDAWRRDFTEKFPSIPYEPLQEILSVITRAEFENLKMEVEELKKLLIAAKIYDTNTGQPECEVDEKVGLIKEVAEALGVDLEDLFDKSK